MRSTKFEASNQILSNGVARKSNSVVTRDGQTIRLAGGFTDENETLFLKQQIERKLNLPDVG